MKAMFSCLLVIALVISMTSVSFAEDASYLASVDWAGEYDVIVAGFGMAGATTALTAAEHGAKVLLVEKAPRDEAGGNSAVCMQFIGYPTDVDQAITYMKEMRNGFNTPSDALIETYMHEMANNMEWIVAHGATNPVIIEGHAEYPEMEGAHSLPYFTADGTSGGNGYAYKLIRSQVERNENIDIWFEAPATKLLQDPSTGIVHGVVVHVDDQMLNIRAKNGVVLCTGGFENNDQMMEDYCYEKNAYSLGRALYNTGDGIKMAMEVGADLWHMTHYVSHLDFVDTETLYVPFRLAPKVASQGAIFVGGDGTRFMNENYEYRHGKYYYHGSFITIPHPETMWLIFDQRLMEQGPIYSTFSADNRIEVEKGWIIEADSVEALAEQIGVPSGALLATITEFNAMSETGVDPYFGRDAASMIAMNMEGKFYAMPLYQTVVNTQGGPVRDENGQILNVRGEAIPHLYEAGEMGDIWSFGYQAGCNIGGGMTFGRISGRNAAAVKDDVTQESVMNGKANYVPAAASDVRASIVCDVNQYVGEAEGRGATPIYVRVTVDNGVLSNVEIMAHSETPGIADGALETIPAAIVAANSTDVDLVSGATVTSQGICNAVDNALTKVGEVIVDERAPQK